MTAIQSFRDLAVWQRSMELTLLVYRLTGDFPKEEMFGLTNQMRRAAVSIPSNIAEGHGRMNSREFRRFLLIARGSTCELQTQLELSRSLAFGDDQLLDSVAALSREVGRMLYGMLASLKSNQVCR